MDGDAEVIDLLGGIDEWDVPNVAAALFDADGIRAHRGDLDRPFALASVSKPLAAFASMIAVEEGSVSLDDPAGPPGSTLRHLLAHASGLGPDGDPTPLTEPGTRRIYSNLGFDAMGDHVARASGMSFADYAHAALIEPLELINTDVSGSPAHGYSSSVNDLVRVTQAVVAGRLLAPETVTALTTAAFADLPGVLPGYGSQDPNPWGLGVEIRGNKSPHWTSPHNSTATWGHFGRSGTFLWFDPSADVGLVVLTDRDFGPWAIEAWPLLSTAALHHTA